MNFFDFLKGAKDNNGDQPKTSATPETTAAPLSDKEQFDAAIQGTLPRYYCTPGFGGTVKVMGPDGNTLTSWADAHPDIYQTWLPVKSRADRRGIIYGLLDQYLLEELALWQKIERYNDDRYPEMALEVANSMKTAADEQQPDFWNALARTNFILTNYVEAEDNCKKAIVLDSANIRTKRILADILHCTNRHHEAHILYAEILAAKIPKDKPVKIALQEMLGFHGDIVNSPIYALAWLKSDPMVTEDVWEWATYEFYYSPHFRSQHAYLLIQKGEHLKAFAKLYSLADEMPWYKEAVINSVNMMNQLGLDDPEMLAKKQRYEKIIRDNKWTFEGMHQL